MKKISSIFLAFFIIFMLSACGIAEQQNKNENHTDPIPKATEQTTPSEKENSENTEILVVYFSTTGTTERIAQNISKSLKADIYEIIPQQPYTDEDIAYYTNSRADREQNDSAARPAISGNVTDFEKYDTVILGYPIWHGQAPRIINTFLESYDFADKTIIPFCTSHSSGLGTSDTNLHGLCSEKAKWINGKDFYASTTEAEIEQWLQEINMIK